MLTVFANVRRHVLASTFALTMLGIAGAAPAYAMKTPPQEPVSSSSGGSSGSTSGGSTGSSSSGSSGGTAVPEPSSMALFGAGAAAFMAARRRKAKHG